MTTKDNEGGQPVLAPRGVWLVTGTQTSNPYPCLCETWRACDPNWCPCAGRVDVENVPGTCCARNGNNPRAAAKARHGGNYRPCWCNGDLDRHLTQAKPTVAGLDDPDADPDHREEEE